MQNVGIMVNRDDNEEVHHLTGAHILSFEVLVTNNFLYKRLCRPLIHNTPKSKCHPFFIERLLIFFLSGSISSDVNEILLIRGLLKNKMQVQLLSLSSIPLGDLPKQDMSTPRKYT